MNLDIINNVPYILVISREYSTISYGYGSYDELDSYNNLYEISDENTLIETISEYESRPKENWHEDFEYKIFTNEKMSENFQDLLNKEIYEKISIRETQEKEEKEQKKQKLKEEQYKRDLEQLESLKIKLGIK